MIYHGSFWHCMVLHLFLTGQLASVHGLYLARHLSTFKYPLWPESVKSTSAPQCTLHEYDISEMYKIEKLCLRWSGFQENIHSTFGELRHDKDFVDVTLACEDGSQVEAHKVILAASSPFFQNLLKKNKHPHPFIYLRGLRAEDLLAILDFLYNGEAKVFHENLDAFLAIAEDLKLKGLAGTAKIKEEEFFAEAELPKQKITAKGKQGNSPGLKKPHPGFGETSDLKERNEKPIETSFVPVTNNETAGLELQQQLDDQIKLLIKRGETMVQVGEQKTRAYICQVCGKEGDRTGIRRHIEAHHFTGIVHPCDLCGKGSKSRDGLRRHRIREHHNIT